MARTRHPLRLTGGCSPSPTLAPDSQPSVRRCNRFVSRLAAFCFVPVGEEGQNLGVRVIRVDAGGCESGCGCGGEEEGDGGKRTRRCFDRWEMVGGWGWNVDSNPEPAHRGAQSAHPKREGTELRPPVAFENEGCPAFDSGVAVQVSGSPGYLPSRFDARADYSGSTANTPPAFLGPFRLNSVMREEKRYGTIQARVRRRTSFEASEA